MFKITHELQSTDTLSDGDINLESLMNDHFFGNICFDNGNGQVIETNWKRLPLFAFSMLLLDACGNLYENAEDEEELYATDSEEDNKIVLRRKGENRIEIRAPFTDIVIETGFKGFLQAAERFNEKLALDIWHRHFYGNRNDAHVEFYIHNFVSPINAVTRQGITWESYV